MTARIRRLAEENMGLAFSIVADMARGYPRHVDREELSAAGLAGLVEAAHRFDPSLGVPFSRFASHRIRGAVVDYLRSEDRLGRAVRAQAKDGAAGPPTVVELDSSADVPVDGSSVEERVISRDVARAVRRAMRALPEDERSLLRLVYWDGLTLSDAAELLGVTHKKARTMRRRAMSSLRRALLSELECRQPDGEAVPGERFPGGAWDAGVMSKWV